jgi:hypothetical protein
MASMDFSVDAFFVVKIVDIYIKNQLFAKIYLYLYRETFLYQEIESLTRGDNFE